MRPQRQPASQSQISDDARRLRQRYVWLQRFSDDEIQKLALCEPGAMLRAGEIYFDVSHPEAGPFAADRDMEVAEHTCLVSKGSVTPDLWTKLTRFS